MDPRFRQSFAEALAKALRENEENHEQQQVQQASGRGFSGDDDLVKSTFEQLHFDQPTGLTARGCRLLGQALIRVDQPQYSLSSRLVSGLEQALDRCSAASRSGRVPRDAPAREPATTLQQDPETSEADNPPLTTGDSIGATESLLRSPAEVDTEESLAASLAQLAWTVHGRIPLHILCYNAPADTLLGSYREAPELRATDASQLLESLPEPREPEAELNDDDPDLRRHQGDGDGSSSTSNLDGTHQRNGSSARPPLECNDNDDEVWATESDPSDYDYGENDLGSVSAHDEPYDVEPARWFMTQAHTMEPLEVAHAIASLLLKISFRSLAELPWSSAVDEELTQLALVLLLPRNHRHGSVFLDCFEESVWQQLALHPIHTMRDAAACHPSTRLSSYLQLLQAMIQVHESVTKSSTVMSMQSESPSLPPATWLSLSLLSSLCSTTCNDFRDRMKPYCAGQDGHSLQQIHSCVVGSMDSLVDILDLLFRPSNGSASDSSVDHRHDGAGDDMLTSLFVPMFRLLAVPLPSPSKQLQSFQLLLNSGFFRQLLLLWQSRHSSLHKSFSNSAEAAPSLRLQDEVDYLEWALLELCLASPKVLGKYAWRYPCFAAAVTDAEVVPPSCVSLEWNLLGMQLCAASPTNLVLFKASSSLSTSSSKPPPSLKECQDTARKRFQNRFKLLQAMVEKWRSQRGNACSGSAGAHNHLADRQCLADFDAMLSRFMIWPLLVEALLSLEHQDDVGENGWKACEFFLPLQRLLATFPKQKASFGERPKSKLDDASDLLDQDHSPTVAARNDSDRNRPDPPSWKLGAQDATVESLRRSLKTLQSLLEASACSSIEGDSTKSDHGLFKFSSKAD